MLYHKFGNIDFKVSIIGFGGASVSGEGRGYGLGSISEDNAITLIRAAFDRGINLFDTAPIYGFGTSEVRIGKALKSVREKAFIVSKSGVGWHDNMRVDMDNDPRKTRKMLEESLKRLDTDYIDLYMVHWPDKKWDIRYPLEVLARAKQEQKIKNIGLCNTSSDELQKAKEVCAISAIQIEHNLFNTQSLADLSDEIEQNNYGVMGWGPLDKGILAGTVKHNRKYDRDDARDKAPWWNKKVVSKKIDLVQAIEDRFSSFSIFELSMAFNLSQKQIHCHLCGAKSERQLDQLLAGSKTDITVQTLQQLSEFVNDKI